VQLSVAVCHYCDADGLMLRLQLSEAALAEARQAAAAAATEAAAVREDMAAVKVS
jgi:hypothetical protein